jgi:predicted outer membrane protein
MKTSRWNGVVVPMSDESRRWSEVGEQLEALALKLKLHFEQTGRREEVPDALQRLRASVGEAFEAAGNAVRDDAVRSDVREAGRLFVDAVSATFSKVSGDLKDVAENMKEKAKHHESAEPPKPIDPA